MQEGLTYRRQHGNHLEAKPPNLFVEVPSKRDSRDGDQK